MGYWCPDCKYELRERDDGFVCFNCDTCYPFENGFVLFDNSEIVTTLDYGLDGYKLDIENEELVSKLHRYFMPKLSNIDKIKILSVGCGGGGDIEELNRLGSEAYGMDFLYRTKYWKEKGYNRSRFFVSSTERIPFPFEYFDVIFCLGVIEHVSEELVWRRNYSELKRNRWLFIKALYDMLKPGGIMIITSPNRNFPIDFQHNSYGLSKSLARFSIYVHSPFTHFLESYYSIFRYMRRIGKFKAEPMHLEGFFGFNVLKLSPQIAFFKNFFNAYIRCLDKMPTIIRTSFLNPYIVLKITKLI